MRTIAGPNIPNSPPPPDFTAVNPREGDALAREMANAYRRMVDYYRRGYKMSDAEALAQVNQPADDKWTEQIMESAPDQVSWNQFNDLAERDPDLVLQRWASIKEAALDELRSGYRGAKAVEGYGGEPMDRARYLAIRHELAREWQPCNGIEEALIDQMAQAYSLYLQWMTTVSTWTTREAHLLSKEEAKWQPPRLSDAEAIERAAAMADRFNRLFIRSLRALRDLRRYPVVVQNVGQMNIGEKQVNVGNLEVEPTIA